jgi:hypothetical protein
MNASDIRQRRRRVGEISTGSVFEKARMPSTLRFPEGEAFDEGDENGPLLGH